MAKNKKKSITEKTGLILGHKFDNPLQIGTYLKLHCQNTCTPSTFVSNYGNLRGYCTPGPYF